MAVNQNPWLPRPEGTSEFDEFFSRAASVALVLSDDVSGFSYGSVSLV